MSHVVQVPLSMRTQYESTAVVGVRMRAHSLYVPATGALNVIVDQPVDGAALVLLVPLGVRMYVLPEASESVPVVIGDVRVPVSASIHNIGVVGVEVGVGVGVGGTGVGVGVAVGGIGVG